MHLGVEFGANKDSIEIMTTGEGSGSSKIICDMTATLNTFAEPQ